MSHPGSPDAGAPHRDPRQHDQGPLVRLAARVAALPLRLYPRDFRRQLGAELRRSLTLRLAAARRRGRRALLLGTLVELAAMARGAVAEGVRARLLVVPTSSPPPLAAMLGDLLRDLRHSIRGFGRSPGFTIVAVLTLALGIGLNTAIFSVIQAVLLRPLPYERPERLVAINISLQGQQWWSASLADVMEWRELSDTLDSVAFGIPADLAVQGEAFPEQVPGARVSADWFRTLGVEATLGRTFVDGEDGPGADRVGILSHGYWVRRLGADPGALGRSLRIDGEETTVVGILPAEHRADFLERPEIYLPLQFDAEGARDRARIYTAVGRLGPDVAPAEAQAEMDRVAAMIEEREPEAMQGWGVRLVPLHEAVAGGQRPLLGILLGAVALVLLVACANVSNLTLARATRRRRELAVRAALGASRGRLVRQLLAETGLLAALGGGGGLLLALWGTDVLLSRAPASIPRIEEAGVDPTVLLFTLVVSLASGLALGLAPALRASGSAGGAHPTDASTRTVAGPASARLRGLLVSAQVALVVMLLVAAALTLGSVQALQRVDLGFEPAGKLVVPMTLAPGPEYDDVAEIDRFFRRLRERLGAIPGVTGVADITRPPVLSNAGMTAYHIVEGRDYEPGQEPTGGMEVVSPGYFELMGMTTVAGRTLADRDAEDSLPVAVINETMARMYWPDTSPLGARIRLGPARSGDRVARYLEVVGIVGGTRYGPDRDIRPRVYIADAQGPAPMNSRAVIVATDRADPSTLGPEIREAVSAVAPWQPVGTPRTYREIVHGSLSEERLQAGLLGLFGLVGLTLGAVGVYAVVAYSVSQRTREMGIRRALGATGRRVLGLLVGGGMKPVLAGLAIGVPAAWIGGRLLVRQLPGVAQVDALPLVAIPLLLTIVALAAVLLPAARATRVDPVESLRTD